MSMQMSLFDNLPQNGKPLPERIADGGDDWAAFPLQRYEQGEETHYAVQDWLHGVALTDNPARFWTDLKKRAQKLHGIQLYASCVQLPYIATNGKKYKMDFATAETLYQIVQYMDTTTGLRNKILAYLAQAGVKLDDIYRDPDKAIEELTSRAKGIEKRKTFADMAFESNINHRPFIGILTNTQYDALFGMVAKELEKALGGKVRDRLGRLALQAIANAEDNATYGMSLHPKGSLTHEQQVKICFDCAMIAARALDEYCALLKVDKLRNQPLLKNKN